MVDYYILIGGFMNKTMSIILVLILSVAAACILFARENTGKKADALYPEDSKYYPEYVGNTWYFQGYKKNAPDKLLNVKAQVLYTQKRDNEDYYYIHAPKMGIRYLNKKRDDGVYMRVIKYPFPLFGFPIDVDLVPAMPIIKFPFKQGDKWTHTGKARAVIFFIPIEKNIRSDFEVMGRKTIKTPAGDIDTWHVKVIVDEGDGKPTEENYWYGNGFGYSMADTTGHYAELVGYRFYDEEKGMWHEKIPKEAHTYE